MDSKISNHGSFGACPWEVKQRQDELFDVAEQKAGQVVPRNILRVTKRGSLSCGQNDKCEECG